jgi:DNA-binding CsgD family transcriptional regulator
MTHLIVIHTDQTFSYLSIQKETMEILADFQLGGNRLQQYGINPQTGSSDQVRYQARCWQDWVVALPEAADDFEKVQLPADRRLTRRQLDVLCCLSEGMTGKQIATRLNIHTRSVSLHISALKRNLTANTTAECVQKAARLGILKPGG